MAITPEILKELMKGYEKPEDLMGKGGILKQLTKALMESAMGAELTTTLAMRRGTVQARRRVTTEMDRPKRL